jgi:hypothetical protein
MQGVGVVTPTGVPATNEISERTSFRVGGASLLHLVSASACILRRSLAVTTTCEGITAAQCIARCTGVTAAARWWVRQARGRSAGTSGGSERPRATPDTRRDRASYDFSQSTSRRCRNALASVTVRPTKSDAVNLSSSGK